MECSHVQSSCCNVSHVFTRTVRYALITHLVRAEIWSISIPMTMGICVAITFISNSHTIILARIT